MSATKKACYSDNDKDWLLDLILRYKNVIENKKTDHTTNKMKIAMWKIIEKEYNSCSSSKVDWKQLQACYDNLKKKARKVIVEDKIRQDQSGNDNFVSKLTPLLNKVLEIVGEQNSPWHESLNKGDGKSHSPPDIATSGIKSSTAGMPNREHAYLVLEPLDDALVEMELDMSVSGYNDDETSGTPSPSPSTCEKDYTSAGSSMRVRRRRFISRGDTPYTKKRMDAIDKIEKSAEAKIELYEQLTTQSKAEHNLRLQVLNEKLKYYQEKRASLSHPIEKTE